MQFLYHCFIIQTQASLQMPTLNLKDNSSELMSCLATLQSERDSLTSEISLDKDEQNKIQLDVQVLVRRLNVLSESIDKKKKLK